MDQPIENDGLRSNLGYLEDTRSDTPPMDDNFIHPASDLPNECEIRDARAPDTHAPDTNLTPNIAKADVPTIPSFVTVAEKFADEFWTSATTAHTTGSPSTTPHAESPTDPFEFVPSPGCSEDSSSKSNADLIEHHEAAGTAAHPCSQDMLLHSNAEGYIEAGAPDVERMPTEDYADGQLDEGLPLAPSDTVWGPSSPPDPLPTPESLALAGLPTPAQAEVDAAWPAPSTDNTTVVDTWGVGISAASDTNYGDTCSADNKATVADAWGNEVKRDNAFNTGWSGGGGRKSDNGRSGDQGYGRGGFRRDRPLWQPPESDGGWDGFRKCGGLRGNRREYGDSGGGRNDSGGWAPSNNDKGYNSSTTDRIAIAPAWGSANHSTKNDKAWDARPAKDVEAAWWVAPEPRIEKPRPEEKKWALPKEGNAWDAVPPPRNGGNPYRPVGTLRGAEGSHNPSSSAGGGAGDTSWGTQGRTKKVLDPKHTESVVRRVLGERARKDTPRAQTQGIQPEEPPDEGDAGDEEGDVTPPPTTPTTPTAYARRSAPYSYVSSRSRRAGSPTLTATTTDAGYISTGTTTTTGRRLTEVVASGLPPVTRARSRAGSAVPKSGGRLVYEGGLEDDEEEYEYIYEETRPPLTRRRDVDLRPSAPPKQRAVYQQARSQYVYVYEGEEEYEDGELYYAPAPPQDSHVRRLAQPKSMSFRVPNTTTDVTITVKEAAPPPPVRYSLARPRPAQRVVYVSEPARRARTSAPRIYEVDDDGYTIAGDDEYDELPVPKGRVYMRE